MSKITDLIRKANLALAAEIAAEWLDNLTSLDFDMRHLLTSLSATTPYGEDSIARKHADNILRNADSQLAGSGYARAYSDNLASEVAYMLIIKAPNRLVQWEEQEAKYQAEMAQWEKEQAERVWKD